MNFLLPDQLHAVWQRIQELVQQPGLTQFQGVTILLHAKNLKTLISGPTWGKMLRRLHQYWELVVDESYMSSTFYFDIAKEMYPWQSYLAGQDTQGLPRAETLFWRRCCLESLATWLRTDDEANASQQSFYPATLLHDSGSITVEPGTSSQLRAAGLIYVQAYNSVKEVFAAGNQYPFRNPAIEALALDPQLQKTWQQVGAGLSNDPIALIKSYLYAKARCHHRIQSSVQKSFGVREEYRVSTSLLARVTEQLEAIGLKDQELTSPQGERPYITQYTSTALAWFRWNINKFCTGFELVSSLTSQRWVTWEHTRVMLMFLRCLRFSYGGGHPHEVAGIWQDTQRQSKRFPGRQGLERAEGLGLKVTVPQYGYGWFLEKVDWDSMTFKEPHSQYMLFNSSAMQKAYRARSRQIRDIQDDFIRVSKVQSLLEQFQGSPQCLDFLHDFLCQLCLCAFRKDVFQQIKPLLKKEGIEEALEGRVPLCASSVSAALKARFRSLNIVSGKRLAVQSIEVLFIWLWGWKGSSFKRTHWDNKPYRLLFRRSYEMISLVQGRGAAQRWRQKLRSSFIRSHWLLPYPQGHRFIKPAGAGSVHWWSSFHAGVEVYLRHHGALATTPASHIKHYPLSGWDLYDGRAMTPAQEPEQSLAWLSESELFEQVSALAKQPQPARLLDTTEYEVYCIYPREDARPFIPTIKGKILYAEARIRALQYQHRSPRAGASDSDSEGSSSGTKSDEEEGNCSENDDIKGCIQEQRGIIQERQRELHRAQTQYIQEQQEQQRQQEQQKEQEQIERQEQRRQREQQKQQEQIERQAARQRERERQWQEKLEGEARAKEERERVSKEYKEASYKRWKQKRDEREARVRAEREREVKRQRERRFRQASEEAQAWRASRGREATASESLQLRLLLPGYSSGQSRAARRKVLGS